MAKLSIGWKRSATSNIRTDKHNHEQTLPGSRPHSIEVARVGNPCVCTTPAPSAPGKGFPRPTGAEPSEKKLHCRFRKQPTCSKSAGAFS
jgi:hypothetical protein